MLHPEPQNPEPQAHKSNLRVYWVAVEELKSVTIIMETFLLTIYPSYGNLN